jgi:hypothetical protein
MSFIIFLREKCLQAIFWGKIPVKQSDLLTLTIPNLMLDKEA